MTNLNKVVIDRRLIPNSFLPPINMLVRSYLDLTARFTYLDRITLPTFQLIDITPLIDRDLIHFKFNENLLHGEGYIEDITEAKWSKGTG